MSEPLNVSSSALEVAIIEIQTQPLAVNNVVTVTAIESIRSAQGADGIGQSLLHQAAKDENGLQQIATLLDIDRDSAKEKDKDGRLPLHLAAQYNPNVEVITKLLEFFPEGAKEKDREGRVPSQLAAGRNPNVEVIATLLEALSQVGGVDGKQNLKDIDGRRNGVSHILEAFRYHHTARTSAGMSELINSCPSIVDDFTLDDMDLLGFKVCFLVSLWG